MVSSRFREMEAKHKRMGKVDMTRKLILIVGLSLSVGAFGCSSSDDNPGGNGGGGEGGDAGAGGMGGDAGTGGDAGAGGTGGATGACINDSDLDVVCMPTFTDDVLTPCATAASGDGAATSMCLQGEGVSADCADCYGTDVQCVRDNCVIGGGGVCFPPVMDQEACDQCAADAGCPAGFDACAGDVEASCIEFAAL